MVDITVLKYSRKHIAVNGQNVTKTECHGDTVLALLTAIKCAWGVEGPWDLPPLILWKQ